jgi:hypothetical protein
VAQLRARHTAGEVLGPDLAALRERALRERDEQLATEATRLENLQSRLDGLGAGVSNATRDEMRLALDVARATLASGTLVSDELARVESTVATLESSQTQIVQDVERTERLLALQRETYELESAARGVRGAEADLAPRIAEVRAALDRGEIVAVDDLWTTLERRMSALAQEREQYDTRADHVIEEYDRYRHLAGETIQKLGRLADNLRRTRRLGQMSIEARAKYEETLVQAEALMGEARAEFEAARELTSTFGADALSDLLGVFDSPSLFDAPLGAGGATPGSPFGLATQPSEPLAAALGALSMNGGARLALLRDGQASWGDLDAVVLAAASDLARGARNVPGTRIVTLEVEDGGLLVLPLSDAVLVAHVEDADSLAAWRTQLLEARPSLL